jgi:hypothetical protein
MTRSDGRSGGPSCLVADLLKQIEVSHALSPTVRLNVKFAIKFGVNHFSGFGSVSSKRRSEAVPFHDGGATAVTANR